MFWNEPGYNATTPKESFEDVSMPIWAVKGEVVIAGDGFCTFKILTLIISINILVVIAPVIVILFAVTLTRQL